MLRHRRLKALLHASLAWLFASALWLSSMNALAAGETTAPKLIPTPNSAAAEPYDFRGIRLGISLNEFRRTPYPDTGRPLDDESEGPLKSHVVCTGDSTATSYSLINTPGYEKDVGVLKCAFYKQDLLRPETVLEFDLDGTRNFSSYNLFKFAHDANDEAMKLYQIILMFGINDMILDSLSDKFGSPTLIEDDTVQNRMGATFPLKTYFWVNNTSSVVVQSPSGDEMTILYSLTDLQDYVDKLIETKKHSIKPRM